MDQPGEPGSSMSEDKVALPPRVLVVDDDEATVALLRRRLERSGYLALSAYDGRQALNLIERHQISCVLLDIVMPGLDGFEVLKRIRLSRPPAVLPVIMVTGKDDISDVVKALGLGANDYVTKPFEFSVVRARLSAQVAVKAGHDRLQSLYESERELLEKTLAGSVKALFDILALADPRAFSKAAKLREWARIVAEHKQIQRPWELDLAAMLSQLGLVGLPNAVLSKIAKGQRLAPEEMALFEEVPAKSGALIANIPRLETVRDIVLLAGRALESSSGDDRIDDRTRELAAILRALMELAALTAGKYPSNREFDILLRRRGGHDPAIIGMLQDSFERAESDFSLIQDATSRVPVSELRPGDILISDIQLVDGTLILAGGQQLTEVALDRIRETGRYAKVKAGDPHSNQNDMKQFREPVQIIRAGIEGFQDPEAEG